MNVLSLGLSAWIKETDFRRIVLDFIKWNLYFVMTWSPFYNKTEVAEGTMMILFMLA